MRDVSLDGRVFGHAIVLSVVVGVVFGLASARTLMSPDTAAALGGRRTTSGPGVWRNRAGLVAVNVALSVLLLVGSLVTPPAFRELGTLVRALRSRITSP